MKLEREKADTKDFTYCSVCLLMEVVFEGVDDPKAALVVIGIQKVVFIYPETKKPVIIPEALHLMASEYEATNTPVANLANERLINNYWP